MLKTSIDKLFELLTIIPNNQFEQEALTYSYQWHLSNNNLDKAIADLNKLAKLNSSTAVDFRILAKINLAKLSNIQTEAERITYFNENVFDVFWKSFDSHKNAVKINNNQATQSALNKDFVTLLYIKIAQHLNNLNPKEANTETLYQYMVRQIKSVYKVNSPLYNGTLRTIRNTIEKIQVNGKIDLGIPLSSATPHIDITQDDFKALFPDYSEIINVNNTESSNLDGCSNVFFYHKPDINSDDSSSVTLNLPAAI